VGNPAGRRVSRDTARDGRLRRAHGAGPVARACRATARHRGVGAKAFGHFALFKVARRKGVTSFTGFALTARHFCQTATKVPKKASPTRTAFAALRFPHSGPAPWARRHGPSMAHRGSPGIHAGTPTAQNLHSASRRGGQIKNQSNSNSNDQIKRSQPAQQALWLLIWLVILMLKAPLNPAGRAQVLRSG